MDRNVDIVQVMLDASENHFIQESGGHTVCPVCGKVLNTGYDYMTEKVSWKRPTQKAHFLSNDKPNNKKYGKSVIDHYLNHTLVCSLECNNAIQVRNNPVLEQVIIVNILYDEIFITKSIPLDKLYIAWCSLGVLKISSPNIDRQYLELYRVFSEYEQTKDL